MAKKKIYRTVIQYEILSEEKISDSSSLNLETIAHECENGSWSGHELEPVIADQELTGKDAVDAIQNHGSSTDFFNMDILGNELEESDELDDES